MYFVSHACVRLAQWETAIPYIFAFEHSKQSLCCFARIYRTKNALILLPSQNIRGCITTRPAKIAFAFFSMTRSEK